MKLIYIVQNDWVRTSQRTQLVNAVRKNKSCLFRMLGGNYCVSKTGKYIVKLVGWTDVIYVKLFCFEVKWSEVELWWSYFVFKWSEVKWSGVELWWSYFVLKWSEVEWSGVMVKFLWTKVPWTLGWPNTEGTWLYCVYFIWCVSCTMVVLTCYVMCGCVYVWVL